MATADGTRQEDPEEPVRPDAEGAGSHTHEEITPRVLIFFDYA
jgi:hypothetical protein